jgi:hypothetical protein
MSIQKTLALGMGLLGALGSVAMSGCTSPARVAASEGEAPASSTAPAADSVWVGRSDGSRSCQPGSGRTLEVDAANLAQAQVTVYESKKGNDGKMYTQMCGGRTGVLNTYRILRTDLQKALSIGFSELK